MSWSSSTANHTAQIKPIQGYQRTSAIGNSRNSNEEAEYNEYGDTEQKRKQLFCTHYILFAEFIVRVGSQKDTQKVGLVHAAT